VDEKEDHFCSLIYIPVSARFTKIQYVFHIFSVKLLVQPVVRYITGK
jgi:hypothetical protein